MMRRRIKKGAGRCLGSARVARVGFDVAAKRTFSSDLQSRQRWNSKGVHEPETASSARVTRALPGVIGSLTEAAAV